MNSHRNNELSHLNHKPKVKWDWRKSH